MTVSMCRTGIRHPIPGCRSIVAHGSKPGVFACGYCHLPNGQGRPENASLAGQPAAYIVQQVADMRSGRAQILQSDKMGSINAMMAVAKASNDAEVKIAADYFSKLKYAKWIRVVETDTVPEDRHRPAQHDGGAARARRKRSASASWKCRKIWSAPKCAIPNPVLSPMCPRARIARGKALVESGAGAFPCAACHGPDYQRQWRGAGAGRPFAQRHRAPAV